MAKKIGYWFGKSDELPIADMMARCFVCERIFHREDECLKLAVPGLSMIVCVDCLPESGRIVDDVAPLIGLSASEVQSVKKEISAYKPAGSAGGR